VARHGTVLNIAVRPTVDVRVQVFAPGSRVAPIVIEAVNYNVRYAPDLDAAGWGPIRCSRLFAAPLFTVATQPGVASQGAPR
jgi:hypothetical protein